MISFTSWRRNRPFPQLSTFSGNTCCFWHYSVRLQLHRCAYLSSFCKILNAWVKRIEAKKISKFNEAAEQAVRGRPTGCIVDGRLLSVDAGRGRFGSRGALVRRWLQRGGRSIHLRAAGYPQC